jgi:hypothetical protein
MARSKNVVEAEAEVVVAEVAVEAEAPAEPAAPASLYDLAKNELDGYTLIPAGIDNDTVVPTSEVVDHIIEGAVYKMVVSKRK